MRLIQFLLAFILSFATANDAVALEQKYVSHSQTGNTLSIKTDQGAVQLTFYNADTVEAFFSQQD